MELGEKEGMDSAVRSEIKTEVQSPIVSPRAEFIEKVCEKCPDFDERMREWGSCQFMAVCAAILTWKELKELRGGEIECQIG
jgi:hypothetical protein